jgi:hypothetical protein
MRAAVRVAVKSYSYQGAYRIPYPLFPELMIANTHVLVTRKGASARLSAVAKWIVPGHTIIRIYI